MIQSYMDDQTGAALFRVRVFSKSSRNPLVRVTRQKGGFKTETEALREETRLKRECDREVLEQESKGVLFCDLLDQWYEHQMKMRVLTGKKSQITLDDSLACQKKWFKDYLRGPAASLNAYVVVGIFEQMKLEGVSVGHRKKIKQDLKKVFDLGIQMGLLPTVSRSPTFEIVLKREEEKMPEILSTGQIQRLIATAFDDGHSWRRVWATALLTGMRSGELYALTWKDVDWERQIISVTKSYNCRKREFKSTKSGKWRHIPISVSLENVLREQLQETGQTEHVFPRFREWYQGAQAAVLRRFCFMHELPSVKFHTLRACFATQMLNMGVDTAKVMKIGGWKELKTMQHYVRLAGVEIRGGTDLLNIFAEGTQSFAASPSEIEPHPSSRDVS